MSRQKPPDLTRTDGHMTESKSTSTTCPVYNTANKPNIVILLNQSFNIEKKCMQARICCRKICVGNLVPLEVQGWIVIAIRLIEFIKLMLIR